MKIKKILLPFLILIATIMLVACNDDVENATVTFMLDGEVFDTKEVEVGLFVERPANPTKENFEFDGWYKSETYTEENRWFFSDEIVEKDTTLYARWVDENTEEEIFKTNIQAPTLRLLEDATNIGVVEDAPDILIIGAVIDSIHYFQNESMSGYEYIKVFNNTNEPYNLKDHRIVLANPAQGQNGENDEAKKGNQVLVTGYLFNHYIDEDIIIDPLDIMIIWLKPYYWVIGSGTGAYNKTFSADLVHTTVGGKKGAFEQTEEDFKEFWGLDNTTKVHTVINQPMIAIRPESGTEDFFPMITPGGGTPYTHLNSSLLRTIEIQKFNDQEGTADVEILNKYSSLSEAEKLAPPLVFGKTVFDTIHITDNEETVDIYFNYANAYKYFEPVVRINFHGLIDENQLTDSNKGTVDFSKTGSEENPGIRGWAANVELQFRPPKVGERVMQMMVPARELRKYEEYVLPSQLELMRIASEEVADYRWENVEVHLLVDPLVTEVNWRRDEIMSPGRFNLASPGKIKKLNLIRP